MNTSHVLIDLNLWQMITNGASRLVPLVLHLKLCLTGALCTRTHVLSIQNFVKFYHCKEVINNLLVRNIDPVLLKYFSQARNASLGHSLLNLTALSWTQMPKEVQFLPVFFRLNPNKNLTGIHVASFCCFGTNHI